MKKMIACGLFYEGYVGLHFFNTPKDMLEHILEVYEDESWVDFWNVREEGNYLVCTVRHLNDEEDEEFKVKDDYYDDKYIYKIKNDAANVMYFIREYHFDSDNNMDLYLDAEEIEVSKISGVEQN